MKYLLLKYKWLMAIICCACFVACEPDSVASGQNPISFGSSRKNSSYNPSAIDVNATLWGYRTYNNTTTTVFNGVDARLYETDETESGYDLEIKSATQYWNIGTYQFYSVSPQLENASITNNALTISDFDISSQTDIIAAVSTSIGVDKHDYNIPVDLTYNHLLARVKFVGYSALDNDVTLKSISLITPKKADYTIAQTSSTCNIEGTETVTISKSDEKVLKPKGSSGYTPNITGDEGFYVHPLAVEKTYFTVTYLDASGASKTLETPICLSVANSEITEWQAGNSYEYTIYIKTSGEIIFGGVTIVNWEEDETNSKDYPFDITP